jgi:prevent-host-death family protein
MLYKMTNKHDNMLQNDHLMRALIMKSATVANAKSHLSALLADVEAGAELVITRRGKPVARLVPEPRSGGFDWADLQHWVAAAPPTPGLTVAEMRDQDLL